MANVKISGIPVEEAASLTDTDLFEGEESGGTSFKTAFSVIKATLQTAFGALYAPIAKGVTNGDSHDHSGGDGAQVDHGGLGGLTDDDHTQYTKHALATAANDFLVASGVGVFVKKTLAETITILRTSLDSVYVALVSSTDNAIARFNGAGGAIQDSGVIIGDNNELYGFRGKNNAQTGTSYTTQDSDHGKIITLSNAAAITLTVHSGAPVGFNCLIIQKGAGQVTVAAGGTGNVRNYDSHTKLAGQYAMGSLYVEANAGSAPEVYLSGNTGT